MWVHLPVASGPEWEQRTTVGKCTQLGLMKWLYFHSDNFVQTEINSVWFVSYLLSQWSTPTSSTIMLKAGFFIMKSDNWAILKGKRWEMWMVLCLGGKICTICCLDKHLFVNRFQPVLGLCTV